MISSTVVGSKSSAVGSKSSAVGCKSSAVVGSWLQVVAVVGSRRFVQMPNSVHLEEGEKILAEAGMFAELAALFKHNKQHGPGLDLIRRLSQDPSSLPVKPKGAAADLAGLPETDLIRQHSKWILPADPDAGVQAFLQMHPPLDPKVVLSILHEFDAMYSSAPNKGESDAHDDGSMCALYLEAALQLGVALPQYYHNDLLLIYLRDIKQQYYHNDFLLIYVRDIKQQGDQNDMLCFTKNKLEPLGPSRSSSIVAPTEPVAASKNTGELGAAGGAEKAGSCKEGKAKEKKAHSLFPESLLQHLRRHQKKTAVETKPAQGKDGDTQTPAVSEPAGAPATTEAQERLSAVSVAAYMLSSLVSHIHAPSSGASSRHTSAAVTRYGGGGGSGDGGGGTEGQEHQGAVSVAASMLSSLVSHIHATSTGASSRHTSAAVTRYDGGGGGGTEAQELLGAVSAAAYMLSSLVSHIHAPSSGASSRHTSAAVTRYDGGGGAAGGTEGEKRLGTVSVAAPVLSSLVSHIHAPSTGASSKHTSAAVTRSSSQNNLLAASNQPTDTSDTPAAPTPHAPPQPYNSRRAIAPPQPAMPKQARTTHERDVLSRLIEGQGWGLDLNEDKVEVPAVTGPSDSEPPALSTENAELLARKELLGLSKAPKTPVVNSGLTTPPRVARDVGGRAIGLRPPSPIISLRAQREHRPALYQRLRDLVYNSPYIDPNYVLAKLPKGQLLEIQALMLERLGKCYGIVKAVGSPQTARVTWY
eukprot:gene23232-30455_t